MKKKFKLPKGYQIQTKEPKLIEENENYKIVEFYFPLGKQVIRVWNTGLTEMKFDKEFVITYGHKNIDSFLDNIHPYAKEKLIKMHGRIPEWISYDLSNGKLWFPLLEETKEEFSDRLEQFLLENKEQMIEEMASFNPVKRMKLCKKLISLHHKNDLKTNTPEFKNLLIHLLGENLDAIKMDLD